MTLSWNLKTGLNGQAKKDIGILKKSNGDFTIPGLDTLEELANKHYPTHTGKKDTVYPEVSITKTELETRYNNWINEEKIKQHSKVLRARNHQAQME